MKESPTYRKVFIKTKVDLPPDGHYFVRYNDGSCADCLDFVKNKYENLWMHDVKWYLIEQPEEEQSKEYSEETLDMMQYVTNLLYAAHEWGGHNFDEWVESEIKNIDEFMKKEAIKPSQTEQLDPLKKLNEMLNEPMADNEKKEISDILKEQPQRKTEVFSRPECIYQYCKHPELCKDKCIYHSSSQFKDTITTKDLRDIDEARGE